MHRRRHVEVDRRRRSSSGPRRSRRRSRCRPLEVVALLLERALGQLAQPRAHDRAAVPQPRDLLEVDRELRLVHQLEALGVGLHHPVLHAVVDHLHEVARRRRRRSGASRPAGRARRGSARAAATRLLVAADHHAVADLEAPDAAGGADVDVVDARSVELGGAAHVVVPVGVAAVDDRVARVEQRRRAARPSARSDRPRGTISQTMRGASSLATRSSSERRAGRAVALGGRRRRPR